MIRQILKMGTPSLLEVSQPILPEEFNQAELLQLIADLVDTQRHLGGVGIAAPQIGINKRVVIIEYYQAQISRYNDVGDCPLRVVINPKLTMIGDEVCAYNEGCLSLPGLRGEVIRPKVLSYEFISMVKMTAFWRE
jgi:peptide deformylase